MHQCPDGHASMPIEPTASGMASTPTAPCPDGHGSWPMYHWNLKQPPEATASCQRLMARCSTARWSWLIARSTNGIWNGLHAKRLMAHARCTNAQRTNKERWQRTDTTARQRGPRFETRADRQKAGYVFLRGVGPNKPRPNLSFHARRFFRPWGVGAIVFSRYTIGIWKRPPRPLHHARGSLPDAPRPDGHGSCPMYHWHLERPPEVTASCQSLIADAPRPFAHGSWPMYHWHLEQLTAAKLPQI